MTAADADRDLSVQAYVGRIQSGLASTRSRFFHNGEDVSARVRSAARRAGVAGISYRSSTRSFVRDYAWTPTGTEARSAPPGTPAADQVAGALVGYVLRWDVPVAGTVVDADGAERVERNAFAPGCFDRWLDDVLPGVVSVLDNHHDPVLGRWVMFVPDEVGLIGDAAIFDTPDGRQTLADARAGRPLGLSGRAVYRNDDCTIEHDEQGPFVLIHRATLREASVVDVPADPGAVVFAVDGHGLPAAQRSATLEDLTVEELLDEVAKLTGVTADDVRFQQRVAEYRRAEAVDEQVRRIERCVSEVRTARRRVEHLWSCYRSRLASYDEVREAVVEADQHEEWLRSNTFGDTADRLLAGLPAKFDLTRRMLDDVHGRSRGVRW
jgi:HK97 family phage prohead protease